MSFSRNLCPLIIWHYILRHCLFDTFSISGFLFLSLHYLIILQLDKQMASHHPSFYRCWSHNHMLVYFNHMSITTLIWLLLSVCIMKFFRNIFREREFSGHDAKVSSILIFFFTYHVFALWIAVSCSILQVALEISFMEAVQGCTKTINFQTAVTCDTCSM